MSNPTLTIIIWAQPGHGFTPSATEAQHTDQASALLGPAGRQGPFGHDLAMLFAAHIRCRAVIFSHIFLLIFELDFLTFFDPILIQKIMLFHEKKLKNSAKKLSKSVLFDEKTRFF